MRKKTYTNRQRKKAFIDALTNRMGNISLACKDMKMTRQTYYDWIIADEEFKKMVKEINQVALDFAEGKLFDLINKHNVTAIIFYLKCRGKDRGYIEKQELEISDNSNLEMKAKLASLPDDVLSALEENIDSSINEKK